MLTIRKSQIEILSEYIRISFEVNSMRELKEKYRKETEQISNNDLIKLIHTGIEKASKYNILDQGDVFVFLEYMICYGNDFDTNLKTKWAGNILLVENLTGSEKINLIRNSFKEEERKEI